MSILERIIAYKTSEEIPGRKAAEPLEDLKARAGTAPPPLDFVAALRHKPGVALIAEVKKASPSKGLLRADFDPLRLAAAYVENGAAAISVLTDAPFFQGGLENLERIRRAHPGTALLRKDFIVDPYQVYEARAAGADALLLIAGALRIAIVTELLELTRSLGMAALIEVHDRDELERILPLAPRLVGANNRDLRDFSVDLEHCLALRELVPPQVCFVAESGIRARADVSRLAAAGVDAMLIGEAFVTADDPGAAVRELIDV
jgi:indole-3-glycerol phosphate synthase